MDPVGAGLHLADWLGDVVALLLVLSPVLHGGHLYGWLGHLDGAAFLPREWNIVALLPGHSRGPSVLSLHDVAGSDSLAHLLGLSSSQQVLIGPTRDNNSEDQGGMEKMAKNPPKIC